MEGRHSNLTRAVWSLQRVSSGSLAPMLQLPKLHWPEEEWWVGVAGVGLCTVWPQVPYPHCHTRKIALVDGSAGDGRARVNAIAAASAVALWKTSRLFGERSSFYFFSLSLSNNSQHRQLWWNSRRRSSCRHPKTARCKCRGSTCRRRGTASCGAKRMTVLANKERGPTDIM